MATGFCRQIMEGNPRLRYGSHFMNSEPDSGMASCTWGGMAHVSHGAPLRMEKPMRQRKRRGQAGGGLPSTGVQALSERPHQPYKSGLVQRILREGERRITGRKTTGSFWSARRVPETKGRVQRKAVFSKNGFSLDTRSLLWRIRYTRCDVAQNR
jgi:hypothetical protein